MDLISKIIIKGFKSMKAAEISFQPVNVLIGGNGAGKSNLISFFDMLLWIKEHQLQNYVASEGGAEVLLYNGKKVTDEIEFTIWRSRMMFYGRLKAGSGDRLYYANQNLYDYVEQHNWYAADGFDELKDNGLVEKSGVFENIGIYHFHDTSASSPMKSTCGIHDNMELASDGRNIAAILYRIKETSPEAYIRIVKTVKMAAPYFHDFILREDPMGKGKIRLEWKKEDSGILFTADQMSDGTLRFICLVTLLCMPEELRKDVILIDEPELGLHPYAISIISDLIKKYCARRQVIAATQSVEFLNGFTPEEIVVVNQANGETYFVRQDSDKLKEWLEDYSIGELWNKNLIGGRP